MMDLYTGAESNKDVQRGVLHGTLVSTWGLKSVSSSSGLQGTTVGQRNYSDWARTSWQMMEKGLIQLEMLKR